MEQSRQIFSLLQVTKSIQKTLVDRYRSSFWVKAEMNKLNHYSHSGHCYPELVEKENGKIIAQINSTLWKEDFLRANRNFLELLNEPLKDGIKILFLARVSFDPAHGLSLRIIEIDPSYTLGDLQKEKQEALDKLRINGLFDRNKKLIMPMLPQRIAIISVETSKGYADFLSVLDNNTWGYKYFHMLFPSLLQGEKAVDGIVAQLHRLKKVQKHFDVVAIIRGGGGDVGLSCYNNYKLASEIASFPLPVITGIGHATNETVSEMVSHLNAITPTKLADFLLQSFHNFSVPVQNAETVIVTKTRELLSLKQSELNAQVKWFTAVNEKLLLANQNRLKAFLVSVQRQAGFAFATQNALLQLAESRLSANSDAIVRRGKMLVENVAASIAKGFRGTLEINRQRLLADQKNINNMSPEVVLRRGYSITMHKGKPVYDAASIHAGDTIETVLLKGSIISIVENTKEKNE